VNSLSKGKVEARGRSKAKVNFHRVRSVEAAEANSSIFIASALIGAFAGTLCVTAAGPGVITAAAGTAALVSNCAPTLGLITPVIVGAGGFPPALLVTIPLAVIAALALVGGLVALHVSTTAALAALAFCPVSNFEQEPMNALVASPPYLAFPEDLMAIMADGLDGGMPRCQNLKAVVLKTTNCQLDDRECHELACREKCCADEKCTFYQFALDNTGEDYDDKHRVVCQLGEKHQLVDKNCDKPFFGEMCVDRLPLWPQELEDHTKCLSGYDGGEGFMVDDRLDCQETALENGHCFYQYNEQKNTCATCSDLSDVTTKTRDNWKVFKDPQCKTGASHVQANAPCTEWRLQALLLSKVKDTVSVRPNARGCRGNAAGCLKKRCRQECSEKAECTFYQFQEGENQCHLGTSELLSEKNVVEPHYGGFVSSERKCKQGFQCPADSQCVDDCNECTGYSQNGPTPKGRGKNKRKWCLRNAVESLCHEGNWDDTYRGVPLNEFCRSMQMVTVDINQTLDARETGENVCRKACCSTSDCAVFQMHADEAAKKGDQLKKGDKIKCWLGLETEAGRPKFKCTGRKLKRYRNKPVMVGKALAKRGCTDGSTACLTKKMCVDHCRTECIGAAIHNNKKGICEPTTTYEDENLHMAADPKHKHAFKENMVNAMPKLLGASASEDSYYVDAHPLEAENYVAQDQIIEMQLHSREVASGAKLQDMSEACGSLKDNDDDELLCWFVDPDGDGPGAGQCRCEFPKPQQCETWFGSKSQMKHVVEDLGMLLFGGDLCTCDQDANEDGEYMCDFGLLKQVPKVRLNPESTEGIGLAGRTTPTCASNKCEAGFDSCSVLTFGDHNCGYSCSKGSDEYYCNQDCDCHKELSDSDIEQKKDFSDDGQCATRTCPGMKTCTVLNYGSYGCGYSCEDQSDTFYFCNEDCSCGEED